MWDWLGKLIPGVSAARLVIYAVVALIVLALAVFTFFTIKGWRDDASQVPSLRQQLAAAQAAKAALDGTMTKRLDGIAGGLTQLGKRMDQNDVARAAADARITAAQAATAGDVQAFLKRYQNAVPTNPACDEPAAVRDGLLNLFPLRPKPQPGAAGGGRQGDGGRSGSAGAGGSSRAASAPGAVPGRQHAAGDRRPVGMSAAARRGAGFPVRLSAAAAGGAGGSTAQRGEPALRAGALAASIRAAGITALMP